jgi:transcriptional regulator with XRE-family HTH domain
MERQFRINWQAIVEQAKQRRKEQNITQEKLAKLAGVSTPTISRFESAEENIEMSSVLNILQVLGMRDSRTLEFPNSKEKYDSERGVIVFTGVDRGKKVKCAISFEALDDHFENGQNPLKNFIKNRAIIENEAKRKYLNNNLENDGSILIKSDDFDLH